MAELPIAVQAESKFQQNPPSGVPSFNVQGGLTFANVNGVPRGLWQRSTRNFMPRLGIAYSMTPKTVLRAGYGIFFEPLGINRVNVNQTGFSSSTAFVPTLDNGQTYVADITNPFPNGLTAPVGASLGASTFLGQNITFFDPNLKNPYIQTWQVGLQRELPFRALIEASYVGNRGTRMRATRDINAVPNEYFSTSSTRDQATINFLNGQVTNPFYPLLPGTNLAGQTVTRSQLLRPYPQFGTVQAEINSGYTWYHGLQARVEKRFSSGFSATYSFTWAKSMQAISYLNPGDPNPEEVVSDLDRPFRNTVMVNYELPFGRGKRWGGSADSLLHVALGGWQLNGVYTLQSGQALGFGNAILTCSPDQVALPSDQRTVQRWFNTDCFNRTPSQQLAGNIRTAPSRFSGIRAPAVNNFDLSLMKRLQIKEGTQLILIGQAINALNNAQFTPPNTTPTSSAFGRITNEYAWQRIVQVGARLQF